MKAHSPAHRVTAPWQPSRIVHRMRREEHTHCAAANGRSWSVTFIIGLGSHSRTLRKQRGRRGSARRDRDEKSCSSSTCR